jgi:hypothetical protein
MTLRGWLVSLFALELVTFLYRKACDRHDRQAYANLPEGEELSANYRVPLWMRPFEVVWRVTHVGALAALLVGAIAMFVLKRDADREPLTAPAIQVLNFLVLAACGWGISRLAAV